MLQVTNASAPATLTPTLCETPRADNRRRPADKRLPRSSTVHAYDRDVTRFIRVYGGRIPCTADELIGYITHQVKRIAPATVARRCMAIQDAHRRAGHPTPTDDPRVREAVRWLAAGQKPLNLLPASKRSTDTPRTPSWGKKCRHAEPITRTLLERVIDAMGTGRRSLDRRDLAVLLLGFAGLKRGTICAINIEDLSFSADAMTIELRVDDDGAEPGAPPQRTRTISLPMTRGPLCAATAVYNWLQHNALEGQTGPLLPRFSRSGEPVYGERLDSAYVSVIVKKRLLAAGVADVSKYSAESLRRGHLLESPRGPRGPR